MADCNTRMIQNPLVSGRYGTGTRRYNGDVHADRRLLLVHNKSKIRWYMLKQLRVIVVFVILCCCCCVIVPFAHGVRVEDLIACTETIECETKLSIGSECTELGYCSNPFYKKGCFDKSRRTMLNTNTTATFRNKFDNLLNNKTFIRVCSSEDPIEAEQLGYCIASETLWNYTEIRFLPNDWESSIFTTWIIQIILNEVLGVPVSMETGYANLSLNFYDQYGRFDIGKVYDWDAMRVANEVLDCRNPRNNTAQKNTTNESNVEEDGEEYISCAHVSMEVWDGQQVTLNTMYEEEKMIEKPSEIVGYLVVGGWYVPKYTLYQDPTLSTYVGLQGDINRQKLANTFLRPTTWYNYCQYVSNNSCTEPDDVAQRAPIDSVENDRMFVQDLYTGYFRKTAENDCTLFPDNCTGHIADYPCGWTSYLQQQVHHLDIPLRSSGMEPYSQGYTYDQLHEIWAAAYTTRSNAILYWWTPDSLFQEYAGTDFELHRINLPPPTSECFANRIDPTERCNSNENVRVGNAIGSCDEGPKTLKRVVATSLNKICNDPNVHELWRNPAYDLIQNYKITSLQVNQLFERWLRNKENTMNSKWRYDTREAVCDWLIDHFDDYVQPMLPQTYPRVMNDKPDSVRTILQSITLCISSSGLILALSLCGILYRKRHNPIITIVQIDFAVLLLFGLILIQLGAFTLALPPTNFSCIASIWLSGIGYTFDTVPLLLKISQLSNRKRKDIRASIIRLQVDRIKLYPYLVSALVFIIVFLMMWTIFDPWIVTTMHYIEANDVSDHAETIVHSKSYCSSRNLHWMLIGFILRGILQFWSLVFVTQSRKSSWIFYESMYLAILVYAEFFVLLWNVTLYVFSVLDSTWVFIDIQDVAQYQSLLSSTDVVISCCIYFVPNLFFAKTERVRNLQNQRQQHEPRNSSTNQRRIMDSSSYSNPSQSEFSSIGLRYHDGNDTVVPIKPLGRGDSLVFRGSRISETHENRRRRTSFP